MNQKLPQHIAIVMDGNGRWAEKQGLPRIEGHRVGVEIVKQTVKSCLDKNIPILSLFAFSSENWARPMAEVEFLMQLFVHAIQQEMRELHERGVHLRFTGDRQDLSQALRQEMDAAEALMGENNKLTLNIVLNYGGKWDIVQAAKTLASRVATGALNIDAINEEMFADCLNTYGLVDPDLFIRTSGEIRISNFFLWQIAYTELYFTEVHWPDFTAEEFEKAIAFFSARRRRYGLIDEQLFERGYV